jgi:hypothetical protein
VYHDDRQVKMLFARLDRSADEPSVWVSAQTVAEVHAGLRRVAGLDESWTIAEANPEYRWHGLDDDYLDLDGYFDDVPADYLRAVGVDEAAIGERVLRDLARRRHRPQLRTLAATDKLASDVVFAYADKRACVGCRAIRDNRRTASAAEAWPRRRFGPAADAGG